MEGKPTSIVSLLWAGACTTHCGLLHLYKSSERQQPLSTAVMTLLPPTWSPPQHNPVCNSQQAHWSGMWQYTCKPGPVTGRDLPEAPGGRDGGLREVQEKSSNRGDSGIVFFWTSRLHSLTITKNFKIYTMAPLNGPLKTSILLVCKDNNNL